MFGYSLFFSVQLLKSMAIGHFGGNHYYVHLCGVRKVLIPGAHPFFQSVDSGSET